MSDEFTFTLNHPITEEQWDMIEDVDFDHTNEIIFYTKHGKEVKFVKASAQPERKTGQWTEKEVKDFEMIELQSAKCSVCNKYHTTPYLYWFDDFAFCPNCGSPMRGEKNE